MQWAVTFSYDLCWTLVGGFPGFLATLPNLKKLCISLGSKVCSIEKGVSNKKCVCLIAYLINFLMLDLTPLEIKKLCKKRIRVNYWLNS